MKTFSTKTYSSPEMMESKQISQRKWKFHKTPVVELNFMIIKVKLKNCFLGLSSGENKISKAIENLKLRRVEILYRIFGKVSFTLILIENVSLGLETFWFLFLY